MKALYRARLVAHEGQTNGAAGCENRDEAVRASAATSVATMWSVDRNCAQALAGYGQLDCGVIECGTGGKFDSSRSPGPVRSQAGSSASASSTRS